MQKTSVDRDKQSGFSKCLVLMSLLSTAVFAPVAMAYYPYMPWNGPFQANPYRGYQPGQHGSAGRWPGYYPATPYFATPWSRAFHDQRPWGSIHGRVTANGNFWVNIRFGGNYRDLQYLMELMQMSGGMQLQLDDAIPGPDAYQDDPWPM